MQQTGEKNTQQFINYVQNHKIIGSPKKIAKFLLIAYLTKAALDNQQTILEILKIIRKALNSILIRNEKSCKLVKKVALMTLGYVIYKWGSNFYQQYKKDLEWKELLQQAAVFKNECYDSLKNCEIPQYDPILVQKVLNSDVAQLKSMLDQNEVSSVQLLNIFMKQSQKFACQMILMTTHNYERSLKMAQECDLNRSKLTEEDKQNKPLYGIPFSVKDSFVVEGMIATSGQIQNIKNVGLQNGRIIQLMIDSGAIPFMKSNVPQMLVNIESYNLIFGNSQNPWDTTRTSGGSSGGESGLIASRCSPFGLGTDIGSSIRQPAAYCGLAGLKPTAHRVSMVGHNVPKYQELFSMQCALKSSAGPIGKTAEDCALMMQALLNKNNFDKLDAQKYPKDFIYQLIPFNFEMFNQKIKKMRIGYYKSFDYFPSCVAHQRAVQESVDILRNLGHECVEIQIPNIDQIIELFHLSCGSDTLYQINKIGTVEPLTSDFKIFLQYQKSNNKKLLNSIKKNQFAKFEDLSSLMNKNENLTIWDSPVLLTSQQYKQLSLEVHKAKIAFMQWFDNQKFDGLISPVTAYPALKLYSSYQMVVQVIYSYIYNILDLPSGTIPVTIVKDNEQIVENDKIKQKHLIKVIEENQKDTLGLPVGVQIAAMPNQEEKVLNIMKVLEEKINFHNKHRPSCLKV